MFTEKVMTKMTILFYSGAQQRLAGRALTNGTNQGGGHATCNTRTYTKLHCPSIYQ